MPLSGEDDDDDDDDVIEIELWPDAFESFHVFQLCELSAVAGGMGGLVWLGVKAVEVRAALSLRRTPRRLWSSVSDDVSYMADTVCADRNRDAKERAEQNRRSRAK